MRTAYLLIVVLLLETAAVVGSIYYAWHWGSVLMGLLAFGLICSWCDTQDRLVSRLEKIDALENR